jgi:hypothetical protein
MVARMSEDDAVPKSRLLTNVVTGKTLALVILFGLALVLASAMLEEDGFGEAGIAALREIGLLLVVTVALTALWDLRARRALTKEILDAVGVSHEVERAGLTRIVDNYLDIDYSAHLACARQVDLFFTYAHTWRATHATDLRALVGRPGTRIRVVLPDASDNALVAQLASRFGYTPEKVRTHVEDAAADMENYRTQAVPEANVEVRFTREPPVFTSYRMDDVCVAVLYSQVPAERCPVPAFEARGGHLAKFFAEQFEGLWNGSVPSEPESTITA